MVGLLAGALGGVGLFLIWWAAWTPAGDGSFTASVRHSTAILNLRDDLVQAGLHSVGPGALLTACALAGGGVFVLALAGTGVVQIALCFGGMSAWAPLAMVRGRARRRRRQLRDAWPDAVDNITSAVRAGLALPQALAQLSLRGPEELRPAFASFAEDYRTTGRFAPCLDALKERLADPVADRLVEALRLAREVGGSDLGYVLRTLSAFLREDSRTRAELEARQSWTINAARLAVASPWIVLAMLATRGESVQAYATRTGTGVLIAGAILTVLAYRMMMVLGRLPEEQRVLR